MTKKEEVTIEIIKNSTIDDYSKKKYCFTEEQMNKAIDDVVKLFAIPVVSNNEVAYCECITKEPEIKAMWVVCAKCGKPIKDV